MLSRLFFIPTLLLSDFSLPLSSYLSIPPFVASLGILSGSSLSLLFAPVSPFPSRSRSFFPTYLLPLLPSSPSASPLLRPCCLSRCLPKVARPNVAAPFVDITQSGCLPPCQTPLAVCRLCSSAIIVRCYYVPPTILVPPMLVEVWITWHTIVSWHSPYYCRFSFPHHKLATPLRGACLSSLFFHYTEEVGYVGPACGILSGPSSNALLLLSDTSPGFYPLHPTIPSWLFPIFSEPRRIDQPVAYCPACLPALSSSLIFPPPPSLPISYHASIFIGSSPGVLVNREVPTSSNFFNLSHLLTRWLFVSLMLWRLLSPG